MTQLADDLRAAPMPTFSHITCGVIADALGGYLDGGWSYGRRAEHDTAGPPPTFRFRIEHYYYQEEKAVDIDIPDVPFNDLWLQRGIDQRPAIKIDGQACPFYRGLVLIAMRLGAAEWWRPDAAVTAGREAAHKFRSSLPHDIDGRWADEEAGEVAIRAYLQSRAIAKAESSHG